MWYVYSKDLQTGREEFIALYDTAKEAVHRIASLYRLDKTYNMEDQYYYFMKQH